MEEVKGKKVMESQRRLIYRVIKRFQDENCVDYERILEGKPQVSTPEKIVRVKSR